MKGGKGECKGGQDGGGGREGDRKAHKVVYSYKDLMSLDTSALMPYYLH